MNSALKNKTALVSGAGRGIGKAVADILAQFGAHVVLTARTAADIEQEAARLRKEGYDAVAIAGDVSREEDVARIVHEAGPVDILINNAGLGVFKPVQELSIEDFDRMWGVNMRGVFLMTKAVLPDMQKKGGGDIVTLSSLAGKNGFKGGSGYCASKWAVRGFMSSLMLEVREENIRVITLFPGSVDTTFSVGGKHGPTITQPEDVASAVLFALMAPRRTMFSEIDLRPTRG
jgi:3-oxoacyl-[acyl-carrier protein] reductase